MEILLSGSDATWIGLRFHCVLVIAGIALRMDGKGAWRDTLFVERLWKSVTYEEVNLPAYDLVPEAQRHLAAYFTFCNAGRPHSALDGRTPDMVYFGSLPHRVAA